MEVFVADVVGQLLIYSENVLTIGLILMCAFAFRWKATIRALRRELNFLLEDKCVSKAKIMDKDAIIQQLRDELNVSRQSNCCLLQNNEEMRITSKLFEEENEKLKDKANRFKNRFTEEEQKNMDIRMMMASLKRDLMEKSMRVLALERNLSVEREDIMRLRERLVETTDMLVLLKRSRLTAIPHVFECQRASSEGGNVPAGFREIIHELISEELTGPAVPRPS